MNWFERYGITGVYFVVFTSLFFIMQITNTNVNNKEIIGVILLVSVLPIGYIISIVSQWLYYSSYISQFNPSSPRKKNRSSFPLEFLRKKISSFLCWLYPAKSIHSLAFFDVQKNKKKGHSFYDNSLSWDIDEKTPEWESEIKSLFIGMIDLEVSDKVEIDKGMWIQKWINKRMDVIAINSAMILATYLSWLYYLVINGYLFFKYKYNLSPSPLNTIIIISMVVVLVCLIKSKNVLIKQLRIILTHCYSKYLVTYEKLENDRADKSPAS